MRGLHGLGKNSAQTVAVPAIPREVGTDTDDTAVGTISRSNSCTARAASGAAHQPKDDGLEE